MNSVFSICLIRWVLIFVLSLSSAVQGALVEPTRLLPAGGPSLPDGKLSPLVGGLSPSSSLLPVHKLGEKRSTTTETTKATSAAPSTFNSIPTSSSLSTDVTTSTTLVSSSTLVATSLEPGTTASNASTTLVTTHSTAETTASIATPLPLVSATIPPSPPLTTSSSPSKTDKDRKTLVIALSITFSILGTIAILLIILLLRQCTKSSPQYQRFRLRCFPFSRGGATPLSDNEIASWREKPSHTPGSEPNAYANLVQRYSRPLSMTRPVNSGQALPSQGQQGDKQTRFARSGNGLNRPTVPPELDLSAGRGNDVGESSDGFHSRVKAVPFGKIERAQRPAPLPPIARAPNARPGLTDQSLPGTPAFILPAHPRRVSRKLSKAHSSPFSPQSLTSPSTPRPSTSNARKPSRRKSMPGLKASYQERGEYELSWTPRRLEEDQVVQRGSLGLNSSAVGGGGGVHSRSQSDMTPFKEAMEGRNRPSLGIRPSFEESMGRVKEEAPR